MPRGFYGIPRNLFMEHSEAFMECQETLPPLSYQEATMDIKQKAFKWNTKKQLWDTK